MSDKQEIWQELKEKAGLAKQGPWAVNPMRLLLGPTVLSAEGPIAQAFDLATAEYIAVASPDVVVALVDELASITAQLEKEHATLLATAADLMAALEREKALAAERDKLKAAIAAQQAALTVAREALVAIRKQDGLIIAERDALAAELASIKQKAAQILSNEVRHVLGLCERLDQALWMQSELVCRGGIELGTACGKCGRCQTALRFRQETGADIPEKYKPFVEREPAAN